MQYLCLKQYIMGKKIVGIAMGGFSSERKISIRSGNQVYESLDKEKWEIYKVEVNSKNWFVEYDDKKLLIDKSKFSFFKKNKELFFDVIFNAIHGSPGEDGKLAAILESLDIPFTSCNSNSAELTFNKKRCIDFAKENNVLTAKSILLNKNNEVNIEKLIKEIGLPCFVKPNSSGSSFGVSRIKFKENLNNGIKSAFKEDDEIIVESELKGVEVSIGIYRNQNEIIPLPITEIVSEKDFFDYEAKYQGKAKEITPANISEEIKKTINKISKDLYQKLNLKGIIRIDFIIVNDKPHLLEINTVPGLTEESIIPKQISAANISTKELFESMLLLALNEKKR